MVTSDGQLDATISTASETYHVEPSARYFDGQRPASPSSNANANVSFPAVIYKSSDVIHPKTADNGSGTGCASHELYLKEWEHSRHQSLASCHDCKKANSNNSQSSDNSNPLEHEHAHLHPHLHHLLNRQQHLNHDANGVPETESEAETSSSVSRQQVIDRTLYSGWDRRRDGGGGEPARRKRRGRSTVDPRKITCMLYLQADHLFYNKMGSEEACIETMTRHVQRVNAIYKNIGEPRANHLIFG